MVAKTLANHRSNARAADLFTKRRTPFVQHTIVPIMDQLRLQTDPSTRYRLMPLMRFLLRCPAQPEAVEAVTTLPGSPGRT
jgi:hypothetical protein